MAATAAGIMVKTVSAETGDAVEFAAVSLDNGIRHIGGLTDDRGMYHAYIESGQWTVKVSSVGFIPYSDTISLLDSATVTATLSPTVKSIGEVVVTAKESHGMSSASVIDREAMSHLQPSSFTDLLELLPGNTSKDPVTGSANIAQLRTAGNVGDNADYYAASLGTSFIIDGVPVNTNAGMQSTPDATRTGRLNTGKGVDMRSLSTDDIESVEVVRGIASAEYGEITGGMINIRRKSAVSSLEARFKADMHSQLFYVGKGIRLPGRDWTLNVSADYLDSKTDPRNNRENFKRVTASVRSNKKWSGDKVSASWGCSLNYSGTFERDRNDPDLTVNGTRDYYTSDNHTFSFNSVFQISPVRHGFFNSLTVTAGLSVADEHLHQEKTVASSRLYPMPVSVTPGSNCVGYLPMVYDGMLDVYGKPFTAYAKADSRFRYRSDAVSGTLKAGIEWSASKNYGDGEVYDVTRPLSAGNTARPRPFNDIPAMHILSAYMENMLTLRLQDHSVTFQTGVRESQLLHLDSRYRLAGRPHFDPRVNVKWTLPMTFTADNNPIGWEISGGIGWHTKMPVAATLYPDPKYTDYPQLNYFHNVEAYRTMNVMTYVNDLTNYDLCAARNLKWEIRGDINYRGNRLSVTYFRENMTDGFRYASAMYIHSYNKYDASGFDPYAVGRAPVIEELPFETETRIAVVSRPTNGSRISKEGVEYTFSSRRIPVVRTRVTVTGAWFRTIRSNSDPLWYKPSIVLNNREIQYAGLYDDRDGMRYQSLNTNITFDTDIPRLALNFSLSVQNMWFTSTQTLYRDGRPTHYIGTDGQIRPYTDDCAADPYLSHLIRQYSATAFDRHEVPSETSFNIKATKRLWRDRIGIALYVNRLLDIAPDYRLYGRLQRRYSSPYFGMELNFKL